MRDMDLKLLTEIGKLTPAENRNKEVEPELKSEDTKSRRTKK